MPQHVYHDTAPISSLEFSNLVSTKLLTADLLEICITIGFNRPVFKVLKNSIKTHLVGYKYYLYGQDSLGCIEIKLKKHLDPSNTLTTNYKDIMSEIEQLTQKIQMFISKQYEHFIFVDDYLTEIAKNIDESSSK